MALNTFMYLPMRRLLIKIRPTDKRNKNALLPEPSAESLRAITIKNSGGDFPICGKSPLAYREIISRASGGHLPRIEIVSAAYWDTVRKHIQGGWSIQVP